ncbi:SpoIIE family protein phosphatase [Streptomyces mobaraensis NBRC 13819 = DSM 40847]|uniref:SpoIIE family protein phosphatase n=2 Tax=Streptomyces mobaraensis TaxID=35621 RepID=A0A5N5W7M2_STRMB|nr:SpoIIE family protein phosphatase [Streptomyces mobaraensis]EME98820.1 magnesium or manganese-dependent protein phosphatase [Streptomyces mobaraensis NBRC 13819 = DSM 40847]KAB7844987.1 SpoIIE family protein phosphatase [Streptomyces mobaraensis]QTT77187.1 SpoIIE family protein phosphatase [Streptomyces mobaraensis NBRC 13819 = DSM 40847]
MDTNAAPDAPGPPPDDAADLGRWALTQFPIGIAVYDRDNRLVTANDEMVRLSGLSRDGLTGRRLDELLPLAPFEEFARIGDEVLRTGRAVRADNYFVSPGDGRERAWASFFTPIKDAEGRTLGLSLAALDVTAEYRARQRLALVNDAGARIGTTLDMDRTAAELAESTVGRFADFVAVDLLPDGGGAGGEAGRPGHDEAVELRRTARRWAVPEDPSGPGPSSLANGTYRCPPHSPPALALATGKPARHRGDEPAIRSWAADAPALPPAVRARGVGSLLAVPLAAHDTVSGLALFVRHPDTEPFDDHDLLLAEEITARAAVCVENARRYARERAVALTLQRSLLPARLSGHTAVEVTSRYLPATAQTGLGGDWYDVIPLSGARVALVVGDVVGHGLQASATMGRLRAAVRTLADIDLPPDELLTHLDDLVVQLAQDRAAQARDGDAGDEAGETDASCLYAVYDPVSRRLVAASADHPPPVLVTPDGTARFLELPPGPALGVGGLPFESLEVEVPEGSLLALYTDGLVEGRGAGSGSGLEPGSGSATDGEGSRLLRRTLARPPAELERVCDDVLAALLPERPADDVALLLARTRALDADRVSTWELTDHPASVADARKRVADQLAAWGLEELAFTTELVVSELVTNAIRHAAPPIRLRLIRDGALICEVSDGSSTSPRMRRARAFDEGGRGLLLVAQLCRRWGTRFTSGGKTIWAEQPLTTVA